jgi:hypothetical protein
VTEVASLDDLVAAEIAAPVSDAAKRLADAIRARHPGAARAVVFYGSCLRHDDATGVHDFYLVVDDYPAAYASRALAIANALLPPNVFYLECEHRGATLRAKYAVISFADLAKVCSGAARRLGLWARFAQPVAAPWVADEDARRALVDACRDAGCTAIATSLALDPHGPGPLDSAVLWRRLFRTTYAAEWRPERHGSSDALYDDRPTRFDAALEAALPRLEHRGVVERDTASGRWRVCEPATLPHPALAKALAAAQLLKSALTFGDWVPYALWKVERHSGVRLEASARQRRHPWIFAWPLVFRALRRGALR